MTLRWLFAGREFAAPLLVCCALTAPALAADTVSFREQIMPLLSSRCFACHGPDVAESGLRLDSFEGAAAEADSGLMALTPGDPDDSELLRRVESEDEYERMPPEGKPLTEEETALLRAWIESGGEYQKHWAFEPRTSPAPPEVADADWAENPIDQFVLAKLAEAGLQPAEPATRRVLVRRLYYDLIGLPPTPEQVEDFVNDTRPDAYERLVDKLLASPHHGEKWARHWLDLVRYAETNSFERDGAKPFAWKYRDYVIRSLNDDKPYDQFVREQLAGDELDEVTIDSITATGFYRLGVWDDEPADRLQAKYDEIDGIVSTTGQAVLGLTVGCARCHDHKIDPIPQTDYYGMVAFFADVTPYASPSVRDPRQYSLWDLSSPLQKERRAELDQEVERRQAAMLAIEEEAIRKMDSPDQRAAETHARKKLLKEKLEQYTEASVYQDYLAHKHELKQAQERLEALPPREELLSLATCDPHPPATTVLMRGSPHAPGDEVTPRFPELFEDSQPEIADAPADARSAGRRRVLAEWITSPDNRLTARVIANRVWQHHFGRGIVRSSSNFGLLGTPPTHPELLDWLAQWLVEHEWRLKPLHRLIVTSSAYQMASTVNAAAAEVDPTNDLFWRFDPRRLTAEEIRDSVLTVSGRLNRTLYGPSVYPKLSDEVLHTQSVPGAGWDTSQRAATDALRRSVYIHVKRSLVPPELASFDFPDTDTSCEARFNTVQPAQALNLLHGQFLREQAGELAARASATSPADLESRVAYVLRNALQREPDRATIADFTDLIDRYQTEHGLSADDSFREFCVAALNLNEFVFLD